jgi:hypothetical protein
LSAHVINKQVIDLKVVSEKNAFRIQQRVRELYHAEILPLLDKMMTQLSPGDEVIRVESLELDLGDLNFEKLDQELIKAFRTQIEEQLSAWLVHQNTGGNSTNAKEKNPVIIKSEEQSSLGLIRYFFTTGLLPWWVPDVSETFDIDELIIDLLKKNPVALLATIREIIRSPRSAQRVIQQTEKKTRSAILAALPLQPKAILEQAWQEITELKFPGIIPFAEAGFTAVLFLASVIINEDFRSKQEEKETVTGSIIKASASILRIPPEIIERSLYTAILYQAFYEKYKLTGDSVLIRYFTRWEQQNLSEAAKISGVGSPVIPVLLEQAKTLSKEKIILKEKIISSFRKQHLAKNIPVRKKNQKQEPKAEKTKTRAKHFPFNQDFPQNKKEEENLFLTDSTSTTDEDEIFIPEDQSPAGITRYGGLVLVAPFLPALFKELRLTDNGIFPGDEERNKAIHLLNFIATGKTKAPEHSLLLHKLLCGVEITAPVPKSVKLGKAEKKEAMVFLDDVAEQWTALRTASGEVLRNTFMKRDGILNERDGAWLLRVERGAVDIMLDTLPWTISIFKAPWMQQFLHVEW